MGSMVEKAIQRRFDALRTARPQPSNAVIADDGAINAKRYELEERCIHTIALPAADGQRPARPRVAMLFIAYRTGAHGGSRRGHRDASNLHARR